MEKATIEVNGDLEWIPLHHDYAEKGFLGTQIDEIMAPLLRHNESLYALLEQLNTFANGVKESVRVHPEDVRSVLAIMLFIKISNCFQSIVLLSRKGLGVECVILSRSLLEVTFPIKILSMEESFAREFVLTEKAKQLRLLNIILSNKESFSPQVVEATEVLRAQLKAEISNHKIRSFTVEELAKKADMYHYYQRAYRNFSEDVHTTVKSLETYAIGDETGLILTFEKGPLAFEMSGFITAAYCLLVALESMDEIFQLGVKNELQSFEEGLGALQKELANFEH